LIYGKPFSIPSGISPRKERATFAQAVFGDVSALLMVEKCAVVAIGIDLSRRRASKPNMRRDAVPRIIEAHDQITVTKNLQRRREQRRSVVVWLKHFHPTVVIARLDRAIQ
jgi:hypothetical protein